jgi:excisionase family DNA binding protein
MTKEKNHLTTGEAAKLLGVSKGLVMGLLDDNLIPGAVRIGSWWRIPRVEVERIAREGSKPKDKQLEAGAA